MKAHAHLPFVTRVSNFLAEIDPIEECSPRTHETIQEIAADAFVQGAEEDLEVILEKHGGYLSSLLIGDIKCLLDRDASTLAA